MKTIFKGGIFIGLIVVTIALAGCGAKTNPLKNAKENINAKIEDGKDLVETGKKMADEKQGFVGGLKDAMKRGVTMKCVTDSADGHWVIYTNGKNTRTEGVTTDGHEMVILAKDKVVYTWDKKTKKGQKIDKGCMDDFQKSMGMDTSEMMKEEDDFDDFTPEKMEIKEKEGSLKCTPSTKADFSVPSDVEFTDQCEMLKSQMSGLKEQMEKFKNMKK